MLLSEHGLDYTVLRWLLSILQKHTSSKDDTNVKQDICIDVVV